MENCDILPVIFDFVVGFLFPCKQHQFYNSEIFILQNLIQYDFLSANDDDNADQ